MAEVDFGDTEVGRPKRFVARQNAWHRLCLLDQKAQHELTHFLPQEDFPDGPGYYVCTMSTLGECKFCALSGRPGQASDRFGIRIAQYQTLDNGQVPTPIQWLITWWSFGIDKFEQLRMFKTQAGDLRQRDIMAYCNNSSYQKMQLQLAGEPVALWLSDPSLKAAVVAAYKEKLVSLDISKLLGRRLSIDEQLRLLSPKAPRMPGGLPRTGLSGMVQAPPTGVKDAFGAGAMNVGNLDSLLSGSSVTSLGGILLPDNHPSVPLQAEPPRTTIPAQAVNPANSTQAPIEATPHTSSAQPVAGQEVDFDAMIAELEAGKLKV